MNTSQKIFLSAVEDLNFTKTAARIYVSQQCVSDHIRRLEEFYGISLFDRYPALQLTPAGEALYKTLSQISLLESDLIAELQMVSNGEVGSIRFGVNNSRAADLFCRFYPAYQKLYPRVNILAFDGDTVNLLKQLESNELDVVLGVNAEYNTRFEYSYLASDSLYLVFPYTLFKALFPDMLDKEDHFIQHGFPPELVPRIPLVLNHYLSTNYQAIASYLNSARIEANCAIHTSNYSLQLTLCMNCQFGAVLPTHILPQVFEYNHRLGLEAEKRLCIFPIAGMNHTLRVDAIFPKRMKMQSYLVEFVKGLENACNSYQEEVRQYFASNNRGTL